MNYLLFTYSLLVTLILIFLARDITFFGRGIQPDKNGKLTMTDQEKMILATQKLNLFYWPSKIHSIENARAQLREVWAFLINIITKLLKSKDEVINVSLSLISNFGCIILIYQILNIYFSNSVAFLGTALYSTSIWPYQIALFLGHILLSQFFFLLSIYSLALMNLYPELSYLFLFISGFLLIICFSSSSASRKYPPIIIFFLIFQLFENFIFVVNYQRILILFLLLIFVFLSFQIFKNKIYITIEKKIKKYVLNPESVVNYVKQSKKIISNLVYLFIPTILMFFSFNSNINIIIKISLFLFGIIVSMLIILYPELIRNLGRYVVYLNIGSWANHFRSYPKNFFKVDTSGDFRAPISWYLGFLIRFCPLIFITFIFCFFFTIFSGQFNNIEKILFIFLSLVPFFVIELSKAIRVAKSYLPILIGMIFLIVVVMSELENILPRNIFFLILTCLILINLIHKIFYLIIDVIPSRLGPSNLAKYLIKNKILEIGTYNNTFNDELAGPIIQKFPNKIKFQFFNSISECKNCNYFLVPQRSAKSVTMETQQFSIKNGDFKLDQKLNEIEKKGILQKIVIKKFKMLGTSRFFVGESEISGFREFCLRDISDFDRDLSYALILDLRKIKEH
tara:strand:+ start:1834 stop:3705 length:1872 start_codon:yes stop_codon:yes gene_type:complete